MTEVKKKAPGFWFFTGDWLKDPELRFCSLFARGLLVDLLCILFESQEQGFASKPDGTPRTDFEIVDAVSGGSREEKISALAELESSGVLSRDFRGVLYSRRLARLSEVSKQRSKSGSKAKQNGSKSGSKAKQNGSKSGSKAKQNGSKSETNDKQTRQQKPGVSDSVSDSVSKKKSTNVLSSFDPVSVELPFDTEEFAQAWSLWCKHLVERRKKPTPTATAQQLEKLAAMGESRAVSAIRHSVANGYQGLYEPHGATQSSSGDLVIDPATFM